MARNLLDALVTEKTLARINTGREFFDYAVNSPQSLPLAEWPSLEGVPEDQAEQVRKFHEQTFIETKNVCAKVHPALAKEIDDICSELQISKRRFLEAAFVEAVRRAKEIMDAESFYELVYSTDGE